MTVIGGNYMKKNKNHFTLTDILLKNTKKLLYLTREWGVDYDL